MESHTRTTTGQEFPYRPPLVMEGRNLGVEGDRMVGFCDVQERTARLLWGSDPTAAAQSPCWVSGVENEGQPWGESVRAFVFVGNQPGVRSRTSTVSRGSLESWAFIWIYSNWQNSVLGGDSGDPASPGACRASHCGAVLIPRQPPRPPPPRQGQGLGPLSGSSATAGPAVSNRGSGECSLSGFDPRIQLGSQKNE